MDQLRHDPAPLDLSELDPPGAGSRDELTAYVRGMERLIAAVRDLASATSIDDVAEIVRHAARELCGADGATFVLRDAGSCYYMDEDAVAPLWRGKRFPMDLCISGWAMLHKQDVAIPDIYRDPRIPHDAYRPTFVRSLTISPIRTADPIGAIGNYWATRHEATPTERKLLQALADSTAVALENVRVMSELEQRVADRTAELAAANRDLEQFAAIAAHDLRNPMSTMAGFAQYLHDEVGSDSGELGDAVRAIARTSRRSMAMIDDLLTFARTGSTELETTAVDLGALVREVVEELRPAMEERGGQVEVGDLGMIEADRRLLRQAIQNLLLNSLTHVLHGVPPRVRVDGSRAGSTVTIRVADNGPGIAPEERGRIRKPFERGSDAARGTGSGLGLAICQRVATHHGGRLVIGDAPEGGAEVSIVLPGAAVV